MTKRYVLHVLT